MISFITKDPFPFIEEFSKNNAELYLFVRPYLWVNQFELPVSPERMKLIDVGALTLSSEEKCLWTSPLIKEFIIQYCSGIGVTTFLPLPFLSGQQIDYATLFNLIASGINMESIMQTEMTQTTNFNPMEASVQVEFYKILDVTFANERKLRRSSYCVKFEGHLEGSQRRFNLLIMNSHTVVIELKIKANTELQQQKAINQVFYYGESLNANICYFVNCTNGVPMNSGFNLTPEERGSEDDEMKSEAYDPVPVVVVHLLFSEDWKKFIRVVMSEEDW